MAGYSGTPLVQKIGIKAGDIVRLINAPKDYLRSLRPLPPDVRFVDKPANATTNVIQLFTSDRKQLERLLPKCMKQITQAGMIWVSWPKKASKVPTTVTENVIREIALPLGLVDI